MKFDIYSYTNKGSRANNEDYYEFVQDGDKGAFVLADGLGGHGFGEIASKLVVKYMVNTAVQSEYAIDDDTLLNLMNSANARLMQCHKDYPEYADARTTVAAAFYANGIFKFFNVGDSRVYYFKNGKVHAQSKDHSVPQMSVALGDITADEIRNHEDRSKLLKVMGDSDNLNITKIEPKITIEQGDAFLLGSDGFWEYVYETEMEIDLLKSSSPKEWFEFMCRRLLRKVSVDNNNDNYTVICGICN